MAAKLSHRQQLAWASQGVGMIQPQMGFQMMGQLLNQDLAQAAILPMNWKVWQNSFPEFRELPMLSQMLDASRESAPVEEGGRGLSAELILSAKPEARTDLLQTYLRQQVCRILGLRKDNLDVEHPLTNMGLDSLMALELKNRIENDLGVAVPMVEFLRGPSIAQISELALGKLVETNPTQTSPQAAHIAQGTNGHNHHKENPEGLLAKVDQLSEEEINSLLNELLTEEEEGSS
jgi:myxalamid-type polyketide synthase MxaB